MRNIVLIVFLCCLLPSCSLVKDVELVDVGEIDSVRVVGDNLILNLSSKVYNPNFFNLKLKSLEFNILKDTLVLGKGGVNKNIIIEKHDTVTISPEININLSVLPDDVLHQEYQAIKVVGFANVAAPINKVYFSLNQTINASDYVALLISDLFREEDFELKKISVNTVSLSNVSVDGVFQILNKNNFSYSIEKVNAEFYATSKYENKISESEINSTFFIEPDSLNVFDFSVKLKTIDAGGFLLSNLFNHKNKVYIKLNTTVKYHNFTFPFHVYEEVYY